MLRIGNSVTVTHEQAAIAVPPDPFTLCPAVVDRIGLVAGNFDAIVPEMVEDVSIAVPEEASARFLQAALLSRRDGIYRLHEELSGMLPDRPREAASRGIGAINFLLRRHTSYAPNIFAGYRPIHANPDWPKYLHIQEGILARFGYYEEPLIGFACDEFEFEGERFPTYAELYMTAVAREKLTLGRPGMVRQPVLS